jgi:polysaccharide biosynthesis transport protein
VRGGVGLADLERKASIAREQYQNLLGTRSQETARRALFQPDSRLVSPATPPLSASSPNLMVNIVLGFALGLAIALATAYFRERWSQCLNTIDDIDRLLGVEFLNSVPTLRSSIDAPRTKDPSEAVVLHPLSSYAEAFRSLATTLLYRATESGDGRGKVIGITSSLPKEGKTTTSISVARVLALSGKSVAIMDADLRRRSITQALAPEATKGWVEVVEGSATLKDILITDGTGATLIPAAPNAHLAASPFSGPAFEQLMHELRRSFDVIVVDTAPVLAVDDTRVLLGHLDALAMLARWRQTPVKAIRAALHQVRSVGGTVVGVAMTMVDLKNQARSGYGDASDYYADMKEYYATE